MAPRKKTQVVPPIETVQIQEESHVETVDSVVSVNTVDPADPADPADPIILPESVTEIKTKAKRQKKTSKHKIVAIITPEGIDGSFQTESRRPLIAHLPIHTSNIHFHDQPLTYDPRPPCQPEAFNAEWSDPFANEAAFEAVPETTKQSELEEVEQSETSPIIMQFSSSTAQKKIVEPTVSMNTSSVRKEYGPTTLLAEFVNTAHTKTLPSKTDLACFWCCEQFAGRPCVIPISIIQSVWQVYGNYCTPQCGMAYLLSEILDTHTRWERISLLNRLYAKQINGRIYPAPSRESLQRFGGPITPQEFHSICESQNIRVDIHMPPMVSILASMDTKPIDFYETPLRNTFASPNQIAIQRNVDEPAGLKLRRTKPLKDKESTLDSCLQITMR